MWIRHLAVTHWRGLDVELTQLSAGMNLVFGPNESGKSRLVEALRFALFESSSGRSAHKKDLATWGVGAEKPRVSVEFELADVHWKVEKIFLGTGHNTVLRSAAETLEGAAAENRLAELMGVGPGGRTEMKPEDRGIWSLLWVDQGASRDAPAHNETSQSRIHDRLTREIGEVAAGELGQRILGAAEEQRNRFYTVSRDAERGILTEPRERVAHLRHRLEDAIARRDAIAADADELDRQRAAERDLATRAAKAEQHLGDVRGQHELAIELGRSLDLYEEQVRTCESKRERCSQALEDARTLAAQIEQLTAGRDAASSALAAAEQARQAAERAVDDARRAASTADANAAEQERQVLELRKRHELAGLREQAERTLRRLEGAAEVRERIAVIQEALAALPRVNDQDVDGLRRAQEARDAARARLEGASASVALEAHQDIRVSGVDLAKGASRRMLVEDEQCLEVEGVVSITVQPGGGELAKLRDAANDAQRELVRLLEALSVTDVAHAEQVAGRRRDQDAEIRALRRELTHHLPDGRDTAEAELRELQTRLDAAGDQAGEPVSARTLEEAEAMLRERSAQRDELRARREAASEQLAATREATAARQSEQASLRRQLDDAIRRREAQPDTAALESALAEAEAAWRQRLAARDDMERRFESLGGGDIQLDLEQATRSHEQLGAELGQVRLQCARLQTRLESAGDDGRHEQVQERAAELNRAETELAAVERQAAAARRLHEVLLEAYENTRERLARPVIDRIRPYLSSLFPGTEVWLDENLNLLGLRGQDTDQHFGALSGGAREQLSLLVRIGLAEVIGADEPWPLVLDDVLVNTDAERIRLVQRLLYQASRHMQILLFTCHGPLFDTLGADRRIELPRPRRAGLEPADARSNGG